MLKGNSTMANNKVIPPKSDIKEIHSLNDVSEDFASQEAAENFWDDHALSIRSP